MKRITELSFTICLTALVSVFAGCPDGSDGGDAGTDGCVEDADCEDGEACHTYSGECVATCAEDADCADDTPICIPDTDANALVTGVCGCDDASCGDGDVCNPYSGTCVTECDVTTASEDECPSVGDDQFACYINEDIDPDALVCQPGCDVNADCPNAAPICDIASGQCLARCDATDEPLFQECDTAAGEICDVASGTCQGGCTGDFGTAGAAPCPEATPTCDLVSGLCSANPCDNVGDVEVAPCGTDETCAVDDNGGDNVCEALCLDLDDCLPTEGLCDTLGVLDNGDDNASYNECIDPDVETGYCDAALASAAEHTADSPIIYLVESDGVAGDLGSYTASVYAPNGLFETTAGNVAARWFVISDTGNYDYANMLPVVTAIGGDLYEVEFTALLVVAEPDVLLGVVNGSADFSDNGQSGPLAGDDMSNVYCFDKGL